MSSQISIGNNFPTQAHLTRWQPIKDRVVAALKAQGRPSYMSWQKDLESRAKYSGCAYRLNGVNTDPIRCGVGHLIPDDVYTSALEGKSAGDLLGNNTFTGIELYHGDILDAMFLGRLQRSLHDEVAENILRSKFHTSMDGGFHSIWSFEWDDQWADDWVFQLIAVDHRFSLVNSMKPYAPQPIR